MKTLRGVVIRSWRDREADKIVTLFTRQSGKMMFRAVSAAKPRAKMTSLTELFVEGDFQVWFPKGGDFGRLVGGKIIRSFSKIRFSPNQYLMASEVCKVLHQLTPLGQSNPLKYTLLIESLEFLCGKASSIIPLAFTARLLSVAGFGQPLLTVAKGDRALLSRLVNVRHLEDLKSLRLISGQERRLRISISQYAAQAAGLQRPILAFEKGEINR